MPEPTTIDDGSPGVPSFSLVPVDHDPFDGPSFSFVPVDHDPFAAGSVASPQTSDGLGALDNLNQPSPVGGAGMPNATSSIDQSAPNAWNKQFGVPNSQEEFSPPGGLLQVVPRYNAMQALTSGQPIHPRPTGFPDVSEACLSGSETAALRENGSIASQGEVVPPNAGLPSTDADLQRSGNVFAQAQSPNPNQAQAAGVGQIVVLPNGQNIPDPDSPTGLLMSPNPDLGAVAAAGRQAGATYRQVLSEPDSAESALTFLAGVLDRALGHGGTFDYQRSGNQLLGLLTSGATFTHLPQFRAVANVNVGLYRQQAGLTLDLAYSLPEATRAPSRVTTEPAPAAAQSRTGATARGLMVGEGVWGVVQQQGRPASGVLWHRSDRPVSFDAAGLEDYEIQESLRNAWDNGYDSVLMKNYIRPGGTKPESIMVVRNLNQLRSPRAAFDPAKKLSPNILAGFGAVAAIPASQILMPLENDQYQQ